MEKSLKEIQQNKLKVLIRYHKPKILQKLEESEWSSDSELEEVNKNAIKEDVNFLAIRKNIYSNTEKLLEEEDENEEFIIFKKKNCNNKIKNTTKPHKETITVSDFRKVYTSNRFSKEPWTEKNKSKQIKNEFSVQNNFMIQKNNLLENERLTNGNSQLEKYTHIIEVGEGEYVEEYEGEIPENDSCRDLFNAIVAYNKDEEDTENDSEDSNASSFYLNSYCEEPDSKEENERGSIDIEEMQYDLSANKMRTFNKDISDNIEDYNIMDDIFANAQYNEEAVASILRYQKIVKEREETEKNKNNSDSNNNYNSNKQNEIDYVKNNENEAKSEKEDNTENNSENIRDIYSFLNNLTEEERAEQLMLMGLSDDFDYQ